MSAQPQPQAMVPYQGDRFLARKKVFSFLGNKFHIYDAQQNLRFFVQQKAFKLKEAIQVYGDEGKTREVMTIGARSWRDFSGTYDVTDSISGQKVGALKREGMKSLLRDEWTILDAADQPIGKIVEDSIAAAVLRRFLSNLIPQSFSVFLGDAEVAEFKQHFNPFVAKYDIDFSRDPEERLDRRLGIAAVVLLLAIEGRQN